jgi:GTP:adenosylcobinamide-phosphate guanylyltransferase
MRKFKTVLIHTSGKAIFELIATEGAYVRDLQLVVEVREDFLYIIDDLMVPFVFVNTDILLEHVKALGSKDDFYHICKC